jgi:hypothetical protein
MTVRNLSVTSQCVLFLMFSVPANSISFINSRTMLRRDRMNFRKATKISSALIVCFYLAVDSQTANGTFDKRDDLPQAEFQMARLIYRTRGGGGSHGFFQPWWAIDYPFAEEHFLPALRRMTKLFVADDSRHLEVTDDHIFDYPFLFMQQPGRGNWNPTPHEAERLREYLSRGGFLFVDDLHGEYDWRVFESSMRRVFPDRPIVEITPYDSVMHVFFDVNQGIQIPGKRHLRRSYGGETVAQMEGPQQWRGIYDDRNRLMVVINFNMDTGDAWEHADDPDYPVPMTAVAYQIGINYVIYSMTH